MTKQCGVGRFRPALIQQGFQASGRPVKEKGFDAGRHGSFYSRNSNLDDVSGDRIIGASDHRKTG